MKNRITYLTLCFIAAMAGCSKKPVATVEFSELRQPRTPLDARYMQIAVRDAQMEGDTAEFDQKKWSRMTADLMQHYLEKAAEKHNIPIKLVDRDQVRMTMEEKDLGSAGVTDSSETMSMAKIKGASAILTSRVTIKVDKQVGKKRSVNAMSVFASAWGGGGGASSEQVDEEARNITVQCQFQLKDPATNEVIVTYNGEPTQDYQKTSASPVFGSSQTEADMAPRDKVIAQFIDRQAQQFLAKFVPVEVRASAEVEPSDHEESIAGVRSLVTDDYEAALRHFKAAIAADANDRRSLFGAGVCCEKLKKLEEARRYYKMAQSLDIDEPKYKSAVERVSQAMG